MTSVEKMAVAAGVAAVGVVGFVLWRRKQVPAAIPLPFGGAVTFSQQSAAPRPAPAPAPAPAVATFLTMWPFNSNPSQSSSGAVQTAVGKVQATANTVSSAVQTASSAYNTGRNLFDTFSDLF